MPLFRYTAIDRAGVTQRGEMEAADEAAVIARLQRDGSIPVRAEPASAGGVLAGLFHRGAGGQRLRAQEVANLTRELAIMLGAGQDLDRALRFLVETAPNARVRSVVTAVRDRVRDGGTLADALSRQPASFSKLYVGLVHAGESGGRLAETLDRLAVLLERQRSLAATVQSALIYPALLVIAAVGSIVLMLTQVLPQFVPLFEQNGAKLPDSTRMLIATGDFVTAYGLAIVLAILLALVVLRAALRLPKVHLAADRLLLRLPVIGGLVREVLAARFTRTLGTLVGNGMPLIAALGIVRDVMLNHAAILAVDGATASARSGAGLAPALEAAGIFPPRTGYLIRLGEENAQLGPLALRAAEIHEESTRINVQRMVSLLVPAITIVMGGAVAAIVASLLMAMLSLNDLAL